MKTSFFKIFFASISALVIFTMIMILLGTWMIGSALQPIKPSVGTKGVLVIDLSKEYKEQSQQNSVSGLLGDASNDVPGLYDVVRMIHYAKSDSSVKGIYIKATNNANGFAANEELRKAILDFKTSKKFVIAYGEIMDEKSYYVATAADKVYCNPSGGLEWDGFASTLFFVKNALDKLEIQPEIFYAGKFKSATEPFRATQMTDPNRLQTTVWLGDLYAHLLQTVGTSRNIDTATLHQMANNGTIQTASDALNYKLIDGLKYDDEVNTEILKLLYKNETENINYISLGKYAEAVNFKKDNGNDKIAIIYAEGDIVGGKGDDGEIGSDKFADLIRKARLDDDVKAIVFRVNSPGGSSLASDVIWRELTLAKKTKPVIVSMGDVAASGGYYISCNADSIFSDETTITGSIGVFSMMANMQNFFKNKLGITFDGVKTGTYADMGTSTRPLTETEKHFIQSSVDTIYYTFKTRVAEGRKKNIAFVDSIAQGRVWTGMRSNTIGLTDRTGTLQDAVNCAARMAKLSGYSTTEYPEKKSLLEQLLSSSLSSSINAQAEIKNQLGESQYNLFMQMKKIQQMVGTPQSRLPFDFDIR